MKRLTRRAKRNVSESKSQDLDKTPNLTSKTDLENNEDPKIVNKIKQSHKFNDSQTRSLIAAVKARPMLWKKHCEFGPSHIEAWENITKELNMEEYGYRVLRQKWMSLRKTFLKHSEKLQTVGHCDSIGYHVNWIYFEELCFLYDEDDDSSEEVSYVKLEPEVEIIGSPAPKKPFLQVSQQGEHQSIQDSQSSIRSTMPFDLIFEDNLSNKLSKPETHSLYSSSTDIINISTPNTPSSQSLETNRKFCNHLSAELRLLSELRSRHLRTLLMKKVHDFMELQRDN